ncbi:carotenoid oxygenase family protein [Mycolicibacillus parakoreensis]|uniref:Dioxygenase n=2 Tax=Mycobacteriaceae TaxID=1762 RepID=A0ABY3TWR7_9MYCO|nr:carotenoid oxygenase family protein [Mycolicibacillus parakoreensis]MCV7315436.1 carotenoid oxygenase family protein [Mycolicibacillus parakoreensis]ULN52100.1 carotenoid oxygenase family protein [Mycolicibacillus parakoreensis]
MTNTADHDFAAYTPLYEEYDYVIDDSDGTLPPALTGTLYRNGAGKLDAGGQALGHLFDGDGMLSMFAIADGAVHYRNRYVRTEHYRKSLTSHGAPLRALGTMRPGGILANALRFPANVANTGVVMHAGKLLALWEGGPPTEINPDTLDTVGVDRFGGELKWLGAFSAHPKWDPDTGEMFNFGLAMVPFPKLICYRVDRAGKLHRLGQLDLPLAMFNHDMGLTSRHLVFAIPPLVFPTSKLLGAGLGLRNFIDAIDYDADRGTLIALVPRDGGKPRIVYTDALLHLHLANSYEDGSDTVVELIHYDSSWEELNGQLSTLSTDTAAQVSSYGGSLLRLRITPSGAVLHEPVSDLPAEFPSWNLTHTGRANRYTYLSADADGSAYPNAIAKVDNDTESVSTFQFPYGQQPHEAVFAARPGGEAEDDGWLLVTTQDGVTNRASMVVLDAADITAGPVYTGRLRHHLPLTFHGCYTPRVARPLSP